MHLLASVLAIVVGIMIIFWTVGVLLDIIGAIILIAGIVWLIRAISSRNSSRL